MSVLCRVRGRQTRSVVKEQHRTKALSTTSLSIYSAACLFTTQSDVTDKAASDPWSVDHLLVGRFIMKVISSCNLMLQLTDSIGYKSCSYIMRFHYACLVDVDRTETKLFFWTVQRPKTRSSKYFWNDPVISFQTAQKIIMSTHFTDKYLPMWQDKTLFNLCKLLNENEQAVFE